MSKSPTSLTSEEDIAVAVAVLEDTLDERSTGPIIHCSLQPEHPYAFEFVISFVNGVTSTYISDFVLNKFPLKISAFHSSLGYEIVSRLSRSLLQLPYPPNARPEGLDDHCHRTQMAPSILEDLCMLLQPNFFEEADSSKRKIRTTQQSKTLRRKAPTGAHTEINDRLFRALGPQVPRTRESAEDMIKSIVDSQKDTLSFFFALLRLPEVKTLVRNAYFRGNTSQGEQVDAAMPPAKGANHSSSITGGDPIQADLHFQSAAGYGQWRILCSRAFLSDMTRDNALSNEVLRRLRELSSGCFDETNQKRLTRDSPIDIFRARLSGSKRLVYLIDVVPEFGSDMQSRGTPRWVYYPMSFGAAATQVATTSTESSLQDQEMEEVDEIHRLFERCYSLEQYSILSQNVIRDILEGREYPRVFQVSLAEKKVIEFTKSSFVLAEVGPAIGRKTTVIVFKIFGIERAWQNRGSVGPRPRQLFITKSQLLANKVEQDYVNLLYSLSAGPNMPQYVRERLQHWNSCRRNNVLDPDDSEGTRDDLPEKFSELQDSHFPLFITVDTLWSLLEADMRPPPSRGRHSRSQQSNNKWLRRTDLVTFDVFKRMYWRHLPQTLTKGIVPSVAFGDIIGTIKGSEKSLDFLNRALDRGTYESLTNRNYTLFEAYQKLKRERGERDLADRTHDLLDKIKEKGLKGELVDFVCVESTPSLDLVDLVTDRSMEVTWMKCKTYSSSTLDMYNLVIVSLCRNPDGFLWAGDTAQTISIGSTFSFKQLGSFVYRYQKSIRAVRGIPSHPKGFQLLVNYRSHGGIVKCANAIIQLLQRFPGAIDVLQPEAGIAGKAMPVFFHSACLPSQERDFFLLSTGRTCMLGSKQCIIVRDEAARQKLRTDIGPVGIILTLFNSKGLEYDDVILYDFFGESANANLWRHLTDAQPHPLEDLKHAPLIYEVRALHTNPQLARHEYETQRHLLNLGLVEEPPTTRNPLEAFANRSSSEEWSEAGKRLLNHGEFEEAAMAFENAGDVYTQAVAVAFHLREVARDTPESAIKRRREAFVAAADAFEHCAAMADNDEEEHSRYVAAARCYAEIKYHQEVLRTLKQAGMYTEAASYCFDNNLLNDAVSLVKTSRVDQETTERVKQVARISYLEANKLEEAAELFDDEEEQMEFVVEHEFGVARAVILGKQRKYGEAVRQYLDEGQELEALELALDHIDDITQDLDAFNAIITKVMWRYLSFGCRGWSENMRIPASKISKLLKTIPLQGLRIREQQMLYLFERIFLREMSTTSRKTLAGHILRCDPLDRASKLLALDLYFDDMSSALDVSSQSGIVSSLHLFHEYSLLMRDGALDRAPWDSPWLCTLFQIETDGEDVRTKPGTFLYENFTRGDPLRPEDQLEHSAVSLSRETISENINRLLWERLNIRISERDRMSSRLSIFDPCIWTTLQQTCRFDHSASHHLDESWFNGRVRFHLQQVMILDNLHAFGRTEFPERIKSQRRLLGALENALNPISYHTGSIASLNEDLIPEAADGFVTVKRWAFDVMYKLDPSREELQGAFLTNLYKAFTLAQIRKEGRTVDNCLRRIPSAWKQQHPRLVVRYSPYHQIYTLRDFLAFMDGSGDLAQGIKFFGYMVQIRLPVDPAVLCTIVERLFGLAIMTARYRGHGSLHGVLLPRTWILALWEDFFRFKDRRLAPLWHLAQATEKLLKDIYTGEYQRHAIMDPRNRTALDLKNKAANFSRDIPARYLQDLCIARINNVVQMAVSLRMFPPPESIAFHWRSTSETKLARYINSRQWADLAEALYQSTTSPFDRLVRLRFESSLISGPQIPGVDLVTIRDKNSIPIVLRPRPGDHPTTTVDTHENTEGSYAAISGQVTATDGIDGTGDQHIEGAAEYSADDAVDIGDGEGPDRSREAIIIQKAVRRYLLKRTEGSSDDKLKIGRDRLFKACKASASAVHARYRKVYLGPLPHLLLCMEWIISSAQASKGTIKARRAEATLQELSDLTLQQTEMNDILKKARELHRRLEPGSRLHPRADIRSGWDAGCDLIPLRRRDKGNASKTRRICGFCAARGFGYRADAIAGVSWSSFVSRAQVRRVRERKRWAHGAPLNLVVEGGRKRSRKLSRNMLYKDDCLFRKRVAVQPVRPRASVAHWGTQGTQGGALAKQGTRGVMKHRKAQKAQAIGEARESGLGERTECESVRTSAEND
ncbi:hypothetical protein BJY52DRAFT_1417616 [Lactarius psammicola]|nr:hypothetical protein BJY52DRAFT_1417616 [Lactarius psammicola]